MNGLNQEAAEWKTVALQCRWCSAQFNYVDAVRRHMETCDRHPAVSALKLVMPSWRPVDERVWPGMYECRCCRTRLMHAKDEPLPPCNNPVCKRIQETLAGGKLCQR